MQRLTITFVLVLLCLCLWAQDNKKNTITLVLGYHHNKSQDLIFSPLIYSGGSLGRISLGYDRITKKGRHNFVIDFDQAEVESSAPLLTFNAGGEITRSASSATFLNIRYGYLHGVWSNNNFDISVGGLLDTQFHLLEYQFALNEDEGYVFTHSASFQAAARWTLSERQFVRVATSFPVLSFVARPTYAIVDNEEIQFDGSDVAFLYKRGAFEGPFGFIKIQMKLDYVRSLSPGVDFLAGYEFRYLRYSDPLAISVVKNGINVGLNFKF